MKLRYFLKIYGGPWLYQMLVTAFVLGLVWFNGLGEPRLLVYLFLLAAVLFAAGSLGSYLRNQELLAFLAGQRNQLEGSDLGFLSKQITKRFKQRLGAQAEQLLQKTYSQEQQIDFMNLWVHQMKTPLSVLELMAQQDKLDPLAVSRETQRLKNGLTLALNQARLSGFNQDFILEPVRLLSLVTGVVNEQKNYFVQQQVFPQVMIEGDLQVISDRKWLAFIIEQLSINSIKYSSAGQNVVIRGQKIGEELLLEIEDFGVGIPQSDLPRIRQAFFTGENGRNHGEATGMGLYLVDSLTQALEIEFDIISEVGQGTRAQLIFHQGSVEENQQ